MKRYIILTILKIGGEAVVIAIVVGIAIGVLGYVKKWDTPLAYSNAFFLAGCLMIIAGGLSRLTSGQEWGYFLRTPSTNLPNMSPSEQANYVINMSSSVRLVILGFSSGILLMLTSVLVMKLS